MRDVHPHLKFFVANVLQSDRNEPPWHRQRHLDLELVLFWHRALRALREHFNQFNKTNVPGQRSFFLLIVIAYRLWNDDGWFS